MLLWVWTSVYVCSYMCWSWGMRAFACVHLCNFRSSRLAQDKWRHSCAQQEEEPLNMAQTEWHQHSTIKLMCTEIDLLTAAGQQKRLRWLKNNLTPSKMILECDLVPVPVSPPLVHLCFSSVILSRTPAVAAERRQGADAVPEQTGAPRHLCHSVFGLFFSFSC